MQESHSQESEFNPTLHGRVKSSYKFVHMGTNYDKNQNNVSICQQCLSYASCDKMIKNSPCKVGLSVCLRSSLNFVPKQATAALESSSKRGSFDKSCNRQEFLSIEMGHLTYDMGIVRRRF